MQKRATSQQRGEAATARPCPRDLTPPRPQDPCCRPAEDAERGQNRGFSEARETIRGFLGLFQAVPDSERTAARHPVMPGASAASLSYL